MAGTFQDMVNRIALEIARPDLSTTQIPNAINDAIQAYQSDRFAFSEVPADGSVTFETVAGQAFYTKADCPQLGTLMKIDHVNININAATIFELRRETPERLIIYNQQAGVMMGQPTWYAYENGEMILSARPDQAYLITLAVFLNVAAPATAVEANNPWMTTAEKLIRCRAKFELATHVTRNPTMAAAMSPDTPDEGQPMGAACREWRSLKGVANRSSGRGIIAPMQF